MRAWLWCGCTIMFQLPRTRAWMFDVRAHIHKLAHAHILTIFNAQKKETPQEYTHTYMLPPHSHLYTTHSNSCNSYTVQERQLSFNLWLMRHLFFSFLRKHYLHFSFPYAMTHFRAIYILYGGSWEKYVLGFKRFEHFKTGDMSSVKSCYVFYCLGQ